MLTFYGYNKCSTCRKARQWLDARRIPYQFVDITTDPPSAATLRKVLADDRYTLKNLFNTSGELYREMKIKDRLPTMSDAAALDLLAQHGKLIKRPIVTDGQDHHSVGFNEATFAEVWS